VADVVFESLGKTASTTSHFASSGFSRYGSDEVHDLLGLSLCKFEGLYHTWVEKCCNNLPHMYGMACHDQCHVTLKKQ
jgi:hypothetical protein